MTDVNLLPELARRIDVSRAIPLDDIAIRSGGDGRTVVAYASVFTPYEVRDQDGHYEERNNPALFTRTLSHGDPSRFQVLFNHGMTIQGTPSERYAMPLGVPLDVKVDGRGLLTVVRYSKTPLGEEVLQLIRDGAIRAMSWSGQWIRSRPRRCHPCDVVVGTVDQVPPRRHVADQWTADHRADGGDLARVRPNPVPDGRVC